MQAILGLCRYCMGMIPEWRIHELSPVLVRDCQGWVVKATCDIRLARDGAWCSYGLKQPVFAKFLMQEFAPVTLINFNLERMLVQKPWQLTAKT